jgi:hypothetical protein
MRGYVHGKLSLPLQEGGIGTDELLRLCELLMRCCGMRRQSRRPRTSTSLTVTPPILSVLMEVVGVNWERYFGSCRWLRRKLLRVGQFRIPLLAARLRPRTEIRRPGANVDVALAPPSSHLVSV